MKPQHLNLITQSLLFSFDVHPHGTVSEILKETERYYPEYVSLLREEYWELVTQGLLVYGDTPAVQSKAALSEYLDPCPHCGFKLDNLIAILPFTSLHYLREDGKHSVIFILRRHGDVMNLPSSIHMDALSEFKLFCFKLAEKYSHYELDTTPVLMGGHLGFKVSIQRLSDYESSDKDMITLFRETLAKSFSPNMSVSLKQ